MLLWFVFGVWFGLFFLFFCFFPESRSHFLTPGKSYCDGMAKLSDLKVGTTYHNFFLSLVLNPSIIELESYGKIEVDGFILKWALCSINGVILFKVLLRF